MQAIFQRRDEELTLVFRQDMATVDFEVISRRQDGSATTERFSDQPKALAYFHAMEADLLKQNWHRMEERRPRNARIHQIFRRDPEETPEPPAASAGPVAQAPIAGVPEAADGGSANAIYVLERPLYCPHCRESIQSIRVVRLMRTQAPFTSTLPRSGRALACSSCEGLLSVELGGIL